MLSVIIPAYNCEKTIKKCVESIIDNCEIIIVNDGSSDGTESVCLEIERSDKRVRYLKKENGGAGSARNLGIEKATGNYLTFIDADDVVAGHYPSCSQLTVLPIMFYHIRHGKVKSSEILSKLSEESMNYNEVLDSFDSLFDMNVFSSACNKVFSAEIIKNNGLKFNEAMTLYEDLDFVLSYLHYIDKLDYSESVTYCYSNDETHYNERTKYSDNLKSNLSYIAVSFGTFGHTCVSRTGCKLYFSVVNSMLMHGYSAGYLKKILPPLFNSTEFISIFNKETLSEDNKWLYEKISAGNFFQIALKYKTKKAKRIVKNLVKKLLLK